ncbi:hypothetical protein HY639_02870 [Candidatus Woesearchaeota archaeon]|nr:hypothetical protein [Candidatus Woesearchaeota archaeon]
MFEKVKGLLAMETQLAALHEQLERHDKTLHEHGLGVSGIHEKLVQMHARTMDVVQLNKEIVGNLQDDTLSITSFRIALEKELAELRLLRATWEKNVAERVSAQVEEGLREQLARLKADVGQYNDLKKELAGMREAMAVLSGELVRLQQAAQSIKQSDGEMVRAMREFLQQDRHKLELMRKVETLERLIASERRRNTQRRM